MTWKAGLLAIVVLGLIGPGPLGAQPAAPGAQEEEIVITRKLPPRRDRLMRVVYIGDLSLKSAAGQQEMENRVGKAVEDMCAIPSPLPMQERAMTKDCREEAWVGARPQMDRARARAMGGGY